MAAKPLDPTHQEQLAKILKARNGLQTAKDWGIDRGTLAEAALGLPKQAGVRCLIESKLGERKKPV